MARYFQTVRTDICGRVTEGDERKYFTDPVFYNYKTGKVVGYTNRRDQR